MENKDIIIGILLIASVGLAGGLGLPHLMRRILCYITKQERPLR
jgi:hypothetical protein